MNVSPLTPGQLSPPAPLREPGTGGALSNGAASFSNLVTHFLHEADTQQQAVNVGMQQLVTGQTDNIHDIAISVARADVAFRMVMEVRDQLVSAYQEVMRMQV